MESNDENIKISSEEIRDIVTDSFSKNYAQPILYLKKAPNAETISNLVESNENILLHNAPIAASTNINSNILNNLLDSSDDTKDLRQAAGIGDMLLSCNQINIAVEEFTNFVIQNTVMTFCAMLDYTGPLFKSIIDYLPVKNYVDESLKESNIKSFFRSYFSDCTPNSFIWLFNTNYGINNINDHMARVRCHHQLLAFQLEQLIYSSICSACDKAITEVLLGTKISPNKPYVIDKASKYYKIKVTGIETAHEVYYRLNIDFVHMIDKLMTSVIVPMCNDIFENTLFTSAYYIYSVGVGQNTIPEIYRDIVRDKNLYNEFNANIQENTEM